MTTQKFDITYCRRSLPVRKHLPQHGLYIPNLLMDMGHHVTVVEDGPLELKSDGVVWIHGNPNWYPTICRDLAAKRNNERPLVMIRHSEPVPHPKAAALPFPRLHIREIVKIILHDARATDVYTNYNRLRRLTQKGLPDLLVVSAPGRCDFLPNEVLPRIVWPLGYDPSHGDDMGLERDIDTLFLGALEIPCRKKLLRRLHRDGSMSRQWVIGLTLRTGREQDEAHQSRKDIPQHPAISGRTITPSFDPGRRQQSVGDIRAHVQPVALCSRKALHQRQN